MEPSAEFLELLARVYFREGEFFTTPTTAVLSVGHIGQALHKI